MRQIQSTAHSSMPSPSSRLKPSSLISFGPATAAAAAFAAFRSSRSASAKSAASSASSCTCSSAVLMRYSENICLHAAMVPAEARSTDCRRLFSSPLWALSAIGFALMGAGPSGAGAACVELPQPIPTVPPFRPLGLSAESHDETWQNFKVACVMILCLFRVMISQIPQRIQPKDHAKDVILNSR